MENENERVFSVEVKSKKHLENVTLTGGSTDTALTEGALGELVPEDITLQETVKGAPYD
ncbi:MAG TPA: hypothetical protein VK536_07835 [Candidatus Limnocylindrales bacterium]|nr:hypothetical protein [Candidatus Limnocylindrales bacterium]